MPSKGEAVMTNLFRIVLVVLTNVSPHMIAVITRLRPLILIILFSVMAMTTNLDVQAASDKPYLNVLGEALAFREGSKSFLDRCRNISDGKIKIGSKTSFWDRQGGIKVAKDIVRRSQICIDQMYPKALELGWMTKAEWERGLRQIQKKNGEIASRFENYLTQKSVKPHNIMMGQCVLLKRNLDDIARDTFC